MRNMREMLGEAGRTMSDLDMLKNRNIAAALGESGRTLSNKDRMMIEDMLGRTMSDNEPMMQDRSPANQMFSIDSQIENLMKSYNMLVNAQEFGRAQEVADQIDQLQQQKIGIQAQNDPQTGFLSNINTNIREMMGESGKTISNQDREAISRLLESISE